jgi:hypothetical protein
VDVQIKVSLIKYNFLIKTFKELIVDHVNSDQGVERHVAANNYIDKFIDFIIF